MTGATNFKKTTSDIRMCSKNGMTDYTLMGVVRVTWPVFLNFALNHIFGVGETRHFKCHVLIDTENGRVSFQG